MPSTHKKVIVRKIDRDSLNGYVSPANYVHEGKLELLNTSGNVVAIDLRDIKGVFFVREFGELDTFSRKTFTSRPRTEGLWVRLKFKDNEVLEGMMPNDLSQTTPDGFLVNPPDLRSNTQQVIFSPDLFGPGVTNRHRGDWRHPPPQARHAQRSASGINV